MIYKRKIIVNVSDLLLTEELMEGWKDESMDDHVLHGLPILGLVVLRYR